MRTFNSWWRHFDWIAVARAHHTLTQRLRRLFDCSNFVFISRLDWMQSPIKKSFGIVFKLAAHAQAHTQVNEDKIPYYTNIHIRLLLQETRTQSMRICKIQITITHMRVDFFSSFGTEWKWTFLLRTRNEYKKKHTSLEINESMKQMKKKMQFINNFFCFVVVFILA